MTVTLIVMWLFAILGAYFWAHKPLPMSSLPGLAATLVNILVWLLLGSVAAGLGRRLAERQLSDDAHVVRLCLSLGLGLGILSLAVLALGLVGLLTPLAGWALLVLCACHLGRRAPSANPLHRW